MQLALKYKKENGFRRSGRPVDGASGGERVAPPSGNPPFDTLAPNIVGLSGARVSFRWVMRHGGGGDEKEGREGRGPNKR